MQNKVKELKLRLGLLSQKMYFTLSYKLNFAEWDVSAAQPDLVKLVNSGRLPGKRVLDIGCGLGDNAIYMATEGYDVTGIDYVTSGIKVARKRASKTNTCINFGVADAFSLSSFKNEFDIVTDFGLYHNVPAGKLPLYLDNITKVLKPGGFFIIQSFGSGAPKSRFGPRLVTEPELHKVFGLPWEILEIQPAEYTNRDGVSVPALLSIIKFH
ncbi:hypothetical protein CHU92_05840 [Flavobacterium cyanobacteriorum]|uniref:Methyltransferase domain-containing protein n=1 Tax=Flavobacterium cyanobacteriorum TaxID=2022802 RepID=A0A255ZA11_9FLAO|nr:class I SAM-dependent methyltransferase [Flavobacterium cyanobacteriorum]OYQ38272.1 hypothetical protein CHU92_05840 [Flavobacterium cyanobacteriorum]